MNIMKKLISFTFVFSAVEVLSSCQINQESKSSKQLDISIEQPFIDLKEVTSTIFLHGSGGSEFDLVPFCESLTMT